MATSNIYALTDNWTSKMSVTDTAYAAGLKMIDLPTTGIITGPA